MMKARRGARMCLALLLVGAMIATALAMVTTPAKADSVIPSTSRFRIRYNPAVMAPPSDAYPPIYEKDAADGSYFLLGEGDSLRNWAVDATANTLRVNLTCMDTWQCNFVYLNITNYDATVFDFADPDPSNMEVMSGGSPYSFSPFPNGTANVAFNWTFDVLKTSGLGADTTTEITFRVQYSADANTAPSTVPELRVRIYLSSIFDDPASITHEFPPNVNETVAGTEDVAFEAGDKFVEGNITFHNFDNAADGFFRDMRAVLTVPATSPLNQITCFGGNNEATNTSGLVNGGTFGLKWRFSIASGTLPGIYPGSVAITYTRGGVAINEGTRITNWTVDYNFRDANPGTGVGWSRDQCWASSVTIVDDGETDGVRSAETEYDVETDYQVSIVIDNDAPTTGAKPGSSQYQYTLPLAFLAIVGMCLQTGYARKRSKK